MNVQFSRLLLAFETLFITLPVTALTLFGLTFLAASVTRGDTSAILGAALALMGVGSLCGGWHLSFAFLFGGSDRLRGVARDWWWIAGWGVALSGVSLLLNVFDVKLAHTDFVKLLVFGLPAVIPFIHLLLERRRNLE